jgi:hypothetical protein
MNIMDNTGIGHAAESPLLPQEAVIREIQRAIGRGYRRLLVLGPPRSRRLACVRKALVADFKLVIIDLGSVRSRLDLDSAMRRSAKGADFYGAMRRLQRQGQRRRVAIILHNFDGCFGSPGEDEVVYRIWSEVIYHCESPWVVFTTRSPAFVARLIGTFKSFRAYVRRITFSSDISGGSTPGQGSPRRAP